MPRTSLILSAVLALLMLSLPMTARAQTGFDRPGSDYSSVAVPSGDPAACALICERDRKCRAWSFSYPIDGERGAACWLKGTVPARVQNNCCVSGVRGAGVLETRNSSFELATDRLGGDYRTVDVEPDAKGETCKAACEADNKCRAWTYGRPGYIGKNARCFLKNEVKPPRRKPGFISGVVR